ncbi:uncharacterized protein LOC116967540 isoform X2 [Amblyraja radiata]|uniref:uncharacterized protein LOC116967540 isoform X1 n=1 Tax=Amblyraja radiata TaxID=386614 RepID=UPI001403F3ED|nr:uncharacterized protein LOC116967540 isoform X1 [Amblyraja radiata]XP_032870062.1 uncharacterized protein LOC116967540 isoform X2 [Amblyraja radiata]
MEPGNICPDQPWVCGLLITVGIVLFLLFLFLLCWWNRAVFLSVLSGYGPLRQSLRCQVECYGRGNVHTDIVRLLNISVCENPGLPLVLFIYKVSRETVDLRNALLWIEEYRGRKREDICAVILLEKSSDTDKPVEVDHLGTFDEKTAVVRIRLIPFYGSREKLQKGPRTNRAMDIIKQSILGWQMECYGEGNVHTDIVRLLNISICEKPGIPLVLFIYKVSHETVDLRNALQWIEDKRGRKREDICAVILLEKSSDTDKKPVEVDHLGTFDEKTAVVRIRLIPFYGSREKLQKGPRTNRAMDIIKQSILGWQSSPAGGDD